MGTPVLVACLVVLRNEFNQLSPNRDKGADGWIGDLAHQRELSDHNPDETGTTPFKDADLLDEVHAIDIDSTGPWPPGRDLDSRVEIIRLNHLHGRDDRLQNIIWRDRVASRSWGWVWQDRPGVGHFDHAHFSARYTTPQENDTSAWGVLEDDMALTEAQTIAAAEQAFRNVLAQGNYAATGPTPEGGPITQPQRFVRDALRNIVGGPTQIDVHALAAALNPLLPGVTVTPEVIQEAFRRAFSGQ